MPPRPATSAWAFLSAVGRHWVALVTGGTPVALFFVVERGIGWTPPPWLPAWFFWALMGFGVVCACYRAWRDERRAREEIEAAWNSGPAIGRALAPLLAEGNRVQATIDRAPVTHEERLERYEREKGALDMWVKRVNAHLDTHCPEHAPAFGRTIPAFSDPGAQLERYLDRLYEIQRALLSIPAASSSRQP